MIDQDRIALIDADTLVWIIAYNNQDLDIDYTKTDKDILYSHIDNFIIEILTAPNCNNYIGFLQGKGNFRLQIDDNYKKNRPEKPLFYKLLSPSIILYLVDKWGFHLVDDMEADDAVCIAQWELNFANTIICGNDKDLLQIPGEHYNYKSKVFENITVEQANYNLWKQMLEGDYVDNIKGIPGIGKKKAKDILFNNVDIASKGSDLGERLDFKVFTAYVRYYGTQALEEFNKNYKLLKLLETSHNTHYKTPIPKQLII